MVQRLWHWEWQKAQLLGSNSKLPGSCFAHMCRGEFELIIIHLWDSCSKPLCYSSRPSLDDSKRKYRGWRGGTCVICMQEAWVPTQPNMGSCALPGMESGLIPCTASVTQTFSSKEKKFYQLSHICFLGPLFPESKSPSQPPKINFSCILGIYSPNFNTIELYNSAWIYCSCLWDIHLLIIILKGRKLAQLGSGLVLRGYSQWFSRDHVGPEIETGLAACQPKKNISTYAISKVLCGDIKRHIWIHICVSVFHQYLYIYFYA